jgi:hypothetical protein
MAVRPRKASDLHGNVPDSASAVLMLVDVINDLNFPGKNIWSNERPASPDHSALKRHCRKAGVPASDVNDNRDRWRSDSKVVISHCCEPDLRASKGWKRVSGRDWSKPD